MRQYPGLARSPGNYGGKTRLPVVEDFTDRSRGLAPETPLRVLIAPLGDIATMLQPRGYLSPNYPRHTGTAMYLSRAARAQLSQLYDFSFDVT